MNINSFINEFRVISASHSEIMSFGYGMDFDINNQKQSDIKFPQLWVQPLNSQMVLGRNNNAVDRTFRLYCYDLEKNDEINRTSVWNTTELILLDIIRLFSYGSRDYRITNNPILMPFQESFGENVSGYYCELVVWSSDYTGTCDIPWIDG